MEIVSHETQTETPQGTDAQTVLSRPPAEAAHSAEQTALAKDQTIITTGHIYLFAILTVMAALDLAWLGGYWT